MRSDDLKGKEERATELFERRLNNVPERKRAPIIEVVDTAYLAIAWLKDQGLKPTANDVLRMTEMILAERKALRAAS